MDEVEYRLAYNSACNAVDKLQDQHMKQALYTILQMIDSQQQAIEDMQATDDEC